MSVVKTDLWWWVVVGGGLQDFSVSLNPLWDFLGFGDLGVGDWGFLGFV